ALDGLEDLQPIELAALQPDVEKDEIGPPRDDGGERFVAVARGTGVVALILQDARDQLADVGFIIDDENVGRHDLSLVCRFLLSGFARSLIRFGRGYRSLSGEAQTHPGAALARYFRRRIGELD